MSIERALLAVIVTGLLTGCSHRKESTAVEYMPNMAYSPAIKAQNEDPMHPGFSAMRMPVAGTVPRGFTPYRYAIQDSLVAQRELVNPLPRTADVLGRGQRVFNTYCIVCHGPKGDGQGYIVPKFPMPPSLLSAKVSEWPDGRIFHIITRGQNLMPSYATQVLPEDRWAVIHYVRALERAAHPTAADLRAAGMSPDSAAAMPADSSAAAGGKP
ncbi:MAG TPA: cytochrome c [Candidatus Polarisedimenticolia bacterium]|nr:cytochrome c [Candidatus Polarisedimenticolia bacterium]